MHSRVRQLRLAEKSGLEPDAFLLLDVNVVMLGSFGAGWRQGVRSGLSDFSISAKLNPYFFDR